MLRSAFLLFVVAQFQQPPVTDNAVPHLQVCDPVAPNDGGLNIDDSPVVDIT